MDAVRCSAELCALQPVRGCGLFDWSVLMGCRLGCRGSANMYRSPLKRGITEVLLDPGWILGWLYAGWVLTGARMGLARTGLLPGEGGGRGVCHTPNCAPSPDFPTDVTTAYRLL